MSRSADIDLTFGCSVSVADVLKNLAGRGWTPVEPLGISYMIEEDDDLDWAQEEPAKQSEVLASLDAFAVRSLHVGISVYRPDAETGGLLLFYPGRQEASFTPSINRRTLSSAPEMTDIAWYIEELVHPLLAGDLLGYQARDMAD
ncbi:hypothetical protein [Actinacidiphila paucisporea]|uniref:Uncharacterized protein n=1 Tax=Actinacidiphila paucisporea TaxID=310782 RepID=A0A1M6YP62_9ACTN|nr:hypothetical protein [Actinacidiphila paucisporea]SHL19809.1 hypothetical protein SAMN05216499_10358 [Actinacidiphila paucisporea]